jgi:nitrogen fixation protein FixH
MTPRRSYWPVAIVAVLVASAAINLIVVAVATRDPSFAVEPDYYRKALAWNATMAQEERNARLGWRADVALDPAPPGGAATQIVLELTDGNAKPVENARISIDALHNARAADVVTVSLDPRGGGRYIGTLPRTRPGLWELRVTAEHGSERFTAMVTRELTATR